MSFWILPKTSNKSHSRVFCVQSFDPSSLSGRIASTPQFLRRLLGRKHLLGPVWFYKSSLSHFLVSYHTELVERRYWSGTMAPHSIAWHDHLLRSSHRVPAKMTGVSGACVRHRRCWRRGHALRCSTAEASPKVKKRTNRNSATTTHSIQPNIQTCFFMFFSIQTKSHTPGQKSRINQYQSIYININE